MKALKTGLLFLIFILLILKGNLAFSYALTALSFWFEKLVPSMFVSMVICRLCLDYNIFSKIPFLFKIMGKLFNANHGGCSLILSSIFLGFPSGAILLDQKVQEKELEPLAAKRLILCVSIATPSFILITCGNVLLKDFRLGLLLWIIEISISFLFLRLYSKPRIELDLNKQESSFFINLKNAVKNSGIALFYIGGYLMMFLTVFNLLTSNLPYVVKEILKAIGEFSIATQSVANSYFPLSSQFAFIAAIIGFNGLCVHLQIFSLCENTPLSYPAFLFLRIIQACLSFSLASILSSLLP